MIKKSLILLIVLTALSVNLFAQNGIDFLSLYPDARGMGLSSADIVESCDINGIYYNPSLLLNIKNISLSISHLNWIAGFKQENIGFGRKIKYGHIGFALCYLYNSSILKTDKYGRELGDMDVYTFHIKSGFASKFKIFNNEFGIGIGLNFIKSVLDEYSGSSFYMDLGMLYVPMILNKRLKLAFVGQNIGMPLKYSNEDISLPVNLQFGAAYYVIINKNHKINLFGNCKYYIKDNFAFPVGLEYELFNIMIFRGAYHLAEDDIRNFSGGIGIKYKRYSIDFAALPDMGADMIYAVTIGYRI